ncbi:MAG: hypothetical protein ABWX96_21330 [Propionibacteriaceae bacterium]
MSRKSRHRKAGKDNNNEDASQQGVWIRSAPDENGRYHVVIETDEDTVFPMTSESAYIWARQIMAAACAAEHDAAIVRQVADMGISQEGMVHLMTEVRADRAEQVPLPMIPDLLLIPGVSHRTGDGFLTLRIKGRDVGEWSVSAARIHALALLTAVEYAVLDGAYLRALTKFGADEPDAMAAVANLGPYRHGPPDGDGELAPEAVNL